MAKLDGNKTSTVKLQLESIISYNLGVIEDVGKYVCDSPGSGTYTPNTGYTIPAGGKDLVVRANQNIESASDMVVTITGTDQASGPLTAQVTIGKQVSRDQSYSVVPADASKKFLTVTSVTATNGIKGDGFEICVLPDSANDVIIGYDQGAQIQAGKEVKPIYNKYDLAHNKRIRGDRTLSLSNFYTNNLEGISRINNREVTIRLDIKDDGGNAITETRYVDQCRLGVSYETPSADDGEVTAKGEGSYGRQFIFS